MQIVVIGGGAAGCFAAITCQTFHPQAKVILIEKSGKLLAKVKVSGGGRCNVTHACFSNAQLVKFYPRGGSQLKKSFSFFSVKDTVLWFESKGVKLKTEADNRMFPVTDNSQTIIDCLTDELHRTGVGIKMNTSVLSLQPQQNSQKTVPARWQLTLNDGEAILADSVIIATGGSPKAEGFSWLQALGHTIIPPVPSLFTFNMPEENIRDLAGVSVPSATVSIEGSALSSSGALLITHWGMSGPAVLRLSAFAAREFQERHYRFRVLVNWLGNLNDEQLRQQIEKEKFFSGKRMLSNKNPFLLPNRLWLFLLEKISIPHEKQWHELNKKETNRLINILIHDVYEAQGKTTFKEEFVTCGGVSLQDISMETMESRVCPGIYFAGEVLDIDGVTGGFNFQAAWTTGFIAGKLGG